MKKATFIRKGGGILFLLIITLFGSAFIYKKGSKRNSDDLHDIRSSINYQKKNFVIYDGIRQANKPNLGKYGIKSINIIYEDSLLDKGVINYKKLDHEIWKASKNTDPICLDIESWDLRDSKYKTNGNKYITVYKYFKKKLPGRKIGYYGMLPYRDLYLYNQRSGANHLKRINYVEQWNAMNNNIAYITRGNDLAFPSFYARNKSMELWKWVTMKQIERLKKTDPDVPVYGFIWPQYWSKEFLSSDDWRFQLETLYQLCDGVVIWGPSKNIDDRKPISWDNNREWWKETLSFIKRYGIGN